MRCKACNRELTDSEAVRKSKVTQEYYDLCNQCFSHVQDSIYYNSETVFYSGEKSDQEDLTDLKSSI